MQQCILLSHVFIREGETDKLQSVEFALKHWRKHNPEAYIIVTGHGLRPKIDNSCNHVIWQSQILSLIHI